MSTDESKSVSPKQTIFEKLEDQIPALGLHRLIAVQNMKGLLDDARNRTRDSHRVQQEQYKATLEGRTPEFDVEPEEEMAGDINVAGDTTHNYYTLPNGSSPAAAGKVAPSLARRLLPLAIAAGTGFGGMWLWNNLSNFEWPGVPDTEYEVRFYNADGELIEVPRHTPKPAD